ncbi:MAG: hypothetical protein J7K26_00620 [Candidatus Aenigmarchaeota archaeon]|nr:hypothetical protein [Candidatus Aenigmarchaeota archaeon]
MKIYAVLSTNSKEYVLDEAIIIDNGKIIAWGTGGPIRFNGNDKSKLRQALIDVFSNSKLNSKIFERNISIEIVSNEQFRKILSAY